MQLQEAAFTFNSATSLTVTTNLAGNYFVRVENNDGGAVRSSTAILAVSLGTLFGQQVQVV